MVVPSHTCRPGALSTQTTELVVIRQGQVVVRGKRPVIKRRGEKETATRTNQTTQQSASDLNNIRTAFTGEPGADQPSQLSCQLPHIVRNKPEVSSRRLLASCLLLRRETRLSKKQKHGNALKSESNCSHSQQAPSSIPTIKLH